MISEDRLKVHLRGLDLFMAQPECVDGRVDAGVQEPRRGGVTQDARRDRLDREGGAALGAVGGVLVVIEFAD